MSHPFRLQVEGWRSISHSYAMVNQFQLLEWAKRDDLILSHRDMPYFFDTWGKNRNPAGLMASDEAYIESLQPSEDFDAVFRIYSPFDFTPVPGKKVGIFMVTEFGLDVTTTPLQDIPRFVGEGGFVATPSHWSKERLVANGIPHQAIEIVPHSVDSRYFHPLPHEVTQAQRKALGFREDEVLLLNVGTQHWAKGMDLLIRAFAMARQQRKDLRLIIKDQRNTYTINTEEFVFQTLAQHHLMSDDVINAITLIPLNLTLQQLNNLYNLADVYVSPYRAEGYNLPVREAMACQTPVMVTRGGATDDFAKGDLVIPIGGVKQMNALPKSEIPCNAYVDPDFEELTERILHVQPKRPLAPDAQFQMVDWSLPTRLILEKLS